MSIKTHEISNRLRQLGDAPIRKLVPAATAVAVFSLGAISGAAYMQLRDDRVAHSSSATSTVSDGELKYAFLVNGLRSRDLGEKRDRAVTNLRAARTQTSKSLSAACRDPRALQEPVTGTTTATESALYDVERYDAALHEYGTPADPLMTYRPVGLYTRDGAKLAYFTDGSGRVQRDPALDGKTSLYQLDWCRSLRDFNAG
ncbi:hypothetical protein [Mycobacteroides abscessus]|uniref:hypothetical protein n=1 Tax=Mycobacteroides abscessus TaxID=36809 RepID=UPI000925BDBA|nr:hypothetical protein [Mycobacteroides abscessus]MBN7332848.1 hypothetical protein [Mycobacteroides abscessus subsp. abscessus]SHP41207.1 Uncharacterised protein [Mycobacteroides abscessus subsp. abscessus]SIE80206.1 Uncharacterised protein [Mycobacteroides abscessus subsp. abscessus]SIF50458.1 Uncharacterised protein [Mycobacteroides abscessus subsp. abscessus]SIG71220.1 Uncharacterised protein [Mycobacteroides abscessus subsp. abscessus]